MTGADWKHPHIVILVAATLVAFGSGYALGGRAGRPGVTTPVITNDLATAPRPRVRPDENALVAENAEREEGTNQARAEPTESRPEPTEPRPEARPEPRPEPRPRPPAREADPYGGDVVDPDALDPDRIGGKPE